MEAIERFKKKAGQQPNEFWIYNYIASFIMYFVFNSNQYLSLFLFPLTIAALHYVLENYMNLREFREYLGYFPIQTSFVDIVIALVVNFILWDHATILLLACLLWLYLSERQTKR